MPGGVGPVCRRSCSLCSGLGLSPSVRLSPSRRVQGDRVLGSSATETRLIIIDARARASRTCQFGRFGAVELGRCDTARLPGTNRVPAYRRRCVCRRLGLKKLFSRGGRPGRGAAREAARGRNRALRSPLSSGPAAHSGPSVVARSRAARERPGRPPGPARKPYVHR